MKTLTLILTILSIQKIKSTTEIYQVENYSAYYLGRTPKEISAFNGYGIKDGWYEAIVKYSNFSTGTNSTYRLNVKVEYNSVVTIDFGNGGSVHNGINHEGYMFTGGYLSFEKDTEGIIIAAKATVSISDKNGMRYFDIRIE